MIDHDAVRFIGEIAAAQGQARPHSIAIACEGRSLTYGQLAVGARDWAERLSLAGVRKGDRIAWLGRSCESYHVLFFALASLGACLTPINYRLAPGEIAYILEDAAPRFLVHTRDKAGLAADALQGLSRPPGLLDIEAWQADLGSVGAHAGAAKRRASADEDILQLYTSGTTGRPKGVRLTNRAYEAFLRLSPGVEGFNYDASETVLIVMPLFHVAGFNVSMMGLAHGARVILLDQFNTARVLQILQAEKVAHVFLAPSMIQMVLAEPGIETADFSALRTIAYGASPIAEHTLKRAQAAFGCGFVQFYGMTESAAAGSYLGPSDHLPEHLLSCGRPWPGVEMAIFRPDGSAAEPGEVGEIVIRGPTLMAGYMNRPEATEEALAGGWLHTGDAGYRDAEGFYYVHDRIKDMIVSGGENVYPAEVEQAIMGCPGVADVAVIGVPSETWGEEVKAVVIPTAGWEPDAGAVIAWTRQRLAGFKTPKSVDFVEALPRNASGKILRRELRAPYWEGRGRQVG